MNLVLIYLSVVILLMLRIDGVEESGTKLFEEEYRDIGKQIQPLSHYTLLKTIHTRHGDIYDCVNVYKKPAFNHPLLKNHTLILQRKTTFSHENARHKASTMRSPKLPLKGRGCPKGTVPIKRLSDKDPIAFHSKSIAPTTEQRYHFAKCYAQESGYTAVEANLATYNPAVSYGQYSAAKIKLQMGSDSIEAGWRVDPLLYGDSKTRLFIRTDVRDAHCFNTLCPGFVHTDDSIPLDMVLDQISTPQQIYGVYISMEIEDSSGDWIFRAGEGKTQIGYWPKSLFQMSGPAQYVEWGGEVFGLLGTLKPAMGSGNVLQESPVKDAFFSNVKVGHQFTDPVNVKCSQDGQNYLARQEGNIGGQFEFLIYYGGPPTLT